MLAAIIAVVAVILDQITKIIVDINLPNEGDGVAFIPGFMSFTRYHNTGGAWSMMDGGGWKWFLLLTVSLLAMGAIVFMLVKYYKRHILLTVSLSMILGGAIGNMIDRFRLGYVIDFLHTEFMDFPTFNVADCFITVGTIALGVYIIFFESRIEKRLKAEKEASVADFVEPAEPIEEQPQDTSKESTEND